MVTIKSLDTQPPFWYTRPMDDLKEKEEIYIDIVAAYFSLYIHHILDFSEPIKTNRMQHCTMCGNIVSQITYNLKSRSFYNTRGLNFLFLSLCEDCIENYRIIPDREKIRNFVASNLDLRHKLKFGKMALTRELLDYKLRYPGFFSDALIQKYKNL